MFKFTALLALTCAVAGQGTDFADAEAALNEELMAYMNEQISDPTKFKD